jgi:5'-3' exonuclease
LAIVVFNGYGSGPSTKDVTHQRRTAKGVGQQVHFDDDMVLKLKEDEFLSNEVNKQRFIIMLSNSLRASGYTVHNDVADADVLIAQTAVECSHTAITVVVGDDTDLLILLCYQGDIQSHNIFFKPQPKMKSKTRRIWHIKETKCKLGREACKNMLFIHALLGCDTTSRIHGIGKGAFLKQFLSDGEFAAKAEIFNQSIEDTSKDAILDAGEKALLAIYKTNDSLDAFRYNRFCQKVATSTKAIDCKTLPPTARAFQFHILRVYLQVQTWKGESLDPEQWGWKLKNGKLMPIQTDLPAAPEALLQVIRCTCKSGCTTRRCMCQKHGTECSNACKECRGLSCENCQQPELEDQQDQDDQTQLV